MTEHSRFWDGNPGIGDGSIAPYDAGTEFAEVMTAVAGMSGTTDKGGIIKTPAGTLTPSFPTPGTLRISPGEAIVYGTWYVNTANVDFVVATPATATRIDRLILRKDWATQTVRLAHVVGTEGGSAPTLTQTVGVVWEIMVVQFSVTTAGIIAIIDVGTRGDLWYRTSPLAIRTDNNIGIKVTPEIQWRASEAVIRLGLGSSIGSQTASATTGMFFRDNSITNAIPENRSIIAGPGISMSLADGIMSVATAASTPNAGDLQVFNEHIRLKNDGTVVLTQDGTIGPALSTASTGGIGIRYTGNKWHSNYGWIDGPGGSVAWDAAAGNRIELCCNSYTNTAGQEVAAVGTVMGGRLLVYGGELYYRNYAIVAQGAPQSPRNRFVVNTAGNISFSPDITQNALNINWPDAGFIVARGVSTTTNSRLYSSPGSLELDAVSRYITGATAGTYNMGAGSLPWAAVYATVGTIQPSLASTKENISALDPAACADAVLNTDWVQFSYIAPAHQERPTYDDDNEEVTPEMREERLANDIAAHTKMVAETAYTRQQKGYVLQSADHRVADLFGLPDRESTTPQSDLAVVACALQGVLQRLAALENRPVVGPQANGGRRGAK